MEIKITPLRIRFDTLYIIQAEGIILVDGGDPKLFGRFMKLVDGASIKPEEIQLIILTHGHWDHVGLTKEIKDYCSAKVMMHQSDLNLLKDFPPSQPPGFTPWGKGIISLLKLYTRSLRIPAFDVDFPFGNDNFVLDEFGIPGKVVHTPGHSPGSVSVVLDSGEAFVGDLAMNMFPMRLSPGLPIFGDDIQVVKDSWRKLREMNVRMVYPAHGKPFQADIIFQGL